MKKVIYQISFLLCFSMLLSCSKEDVKKQITDQQRVAQSLKNGSPWVVLSVDSKPDGVDDKLLSDLQISFGITGSGSSIMPGAFSSNCSIKSFTSDQGATWAWTGVGVSSISLTNGFVSEITDIQFSSSIDSPTSIRITFAMTKEINARVEGIGKYTITLK